jgi:hypothetical protein
MLDVSPNIDNISEMHSWLRVREFYHEGTEEIRAEVVNVFLVRIREH